jgi:hypothetical protein
MAAMLPVEPGRIGEVQIGFVNQVRHLQGLAGALIL